MDACCDSGEQVGHGHVLFGGMQMEDGNVRGARLRSETWAAAVWLAIRGSSVAWEWSAVDRQVHQAVSRYDVDAALVESLGSSWPSWAVHKHKGTLPPPPLLLPLP